MRRFEKKHAVTFNVQKGVNQCSFNILYLSDEQRTFIHSLVDLSDPEMGLKRSEKMSGNEESFSHAG